MLSRHIKLKPALKLSNWRKVALGTWKTVGDPSVYAMLDIEIAPALQYLEGLKQKTGKRVTLSHFLGKAIAMAIEKYPDINCVLRFGRLYPREHIDVFFQVAMDTAGKELSGSVVRDVNRKNLGEISDELSRDVKQIRERGDPAFKKMKKKMGTIPGFFTPYVIDLMSWILYSLNLWSPAFGSPRDPFGSVMITNIGTLDLDVAFAPLVPYSRVPLLLALGKIKDVPIVRNGKVEATQVCTISVTFDHRLIDGALASRMAKNLCSYFANPAQMLGEL